MKRVKLMLLSFCVLAVVAGALAFKTKGNLTFCYAQVNGSSPYCNKKCPTFTTRAKATTDEVFICTTPSTNDPASPCSVNNVFLNCDGISYQTTTTE